MRRLNKIIKFLNNFYSLNELQVEIHKIEREIFGINNARIDAEICKISTTFYKGYTDTQYEWTEN